jgi:hypothetical protein
MAIESLLTLSQIDIVGRAEYMCMMGNSSLPMVQLALVDLFSKPLHYFP